MTKVAWLGDALADLRGIRDYIARDNPAAAKRVVKTIRDATAILQDHPGVGRPGRIDGTRELIIRPYPYIVAYRQVESLVHVLAVVHTSRLWPDELP